MPLLDLHDIALHKFIATFNATAKVNACFYLFYRHLRAPLLRMSVSSLSTSLIGVNEGFSAIFFCAFEGFTSNTTVLVMVYLY
jgi:hypothetical protein